LRALNEKKGSLPRVYIHTYMPSLTDLKAELEDIQTLKFISSAFTEASSAKIKKIRAAFETNAEFYRDITKVYHIVQAAAEKLEEEDKKKHTGEYREGTLFAAITSNQRFYGSLNINIMRKFIADAKTANPVLLVVGATGRDYLASTRFPKKYEIQLFEKDTPSKKEVMTFMEYVKPYKTVMLYYPRFRSLMSQDVGVMDIALREEHGELAKDDESQTLFEPEVSQMLNFFETSVRSVLFFRVMLEVDLARTAARLMTMSAAEQNANELEKEKHSQLLKVTNSYLNARLMETFSGMSKWKGK